MRPAGHLRRDHGLRRQSGPALSLQPSAFAARVVHGDEARTANGDETGRGGTSEAGGGPYLPPDRGGRGARLSGSQRAIRQSGSAGVRRGRAAQSLHPKQHGDPPVAVRRRERGRTVAVQGVRIGNHRIQLNVSDGAVVAMEARGETQGGPRIDRAYPLVRVENARSHCEQARAAGARIIREPADHPYGECQYTAEDLAGHQWTFSQSIADVDPRDWGGEPAQV